MDEKEKKIQAGYYLVSLLRSALNDEKTTALPQEIAMEDVYEMAKRHSVEYIAYCGAEKILENDKELAEEWKKRSMKCAMQGVVQLAERDRLCHMFSEAGIRILPLKGCLLKEIYPRQEFRQMSDLDILIDEENALTAKELLENAGYTAVGRFGYRNHDEYKKKPWCSVEMHRELLPEDEKNAEKYRTVWQYAYEENPGSGIYRMTWEDFYIFMLQHFAKHLYSAGSGIRLVMDVHVFLKSKGHLLDRKYLKKQLKELELWELTELTEQIAENWFEKNRVGVFKETEELIITSGIYGTREQYYQTKIEQLEKKYHSKGLAWIVYIARNHLFLKYDSMCVAYPALKGRRLLLPFFWIYRIFETLFQKRYKIIKILGIMRRVNKENEN